MNIIELCFGGSTPTNDGFIELSIGGVQASQRTWVQRSTFAAQIETEGHENCYFGPTLRRKPNVLGKQNFLASRVCWVDLDQPQFVKPIAPPSAVVWSGHGFHLYWLLDDWQYDPKKIEALNEWLQSSIGGDSCHNVDRLLRIPGSINAKDGQRVECRTTEIRPQRIYRIADLTAITRLSERAATKILTGDRRGYRSRSERDWAIACALVSAGVSDDVITSIFSYHECGDKYRDPAVDGVKYLRRTLIKARSRKGKGVQPSILVENADGYSIETSKGVRRISAFVLKPTQLLEGPNEDAIMCDVMAAGTDHVWRDVVFPVSAFSSDGALRRQLTKAAWVWLGRGQDVGLLQSHLVAKLQSNGLPRAVATSVVGRHTIPGDSRKFFVLNEYVMASDGSHWGPRESPIVFVEQGREHPHVTIRGMQTDYTFIAALANALPFVNAPGVIWPVLGWFMAAPMKVALEACEYRFPILNVFGTRGSGKTTTILRIFHRMFGWRDERSYDANTTRFVMLTLMGSTNAIPLAFSEFRVAQVTDLSRYVLLAYDTGMDARGRANQTTQNYPLIAPFSIDGEDMLDDPASLERIVAVRMVPQVIAEGGNAHGAFQQLQSLELSEFAGPYLAYTLGIDVPRLLDAAEDDIAQAFQVELPQRIRRNITVVWFGVLAFNAFAERYGIECIPDEGAVVLRQALEHVYSPRLGRAPTEADSFIEVTVNAAARGVRAFPWSVDGSTLWFQLMPAFEYYVIQRAHQRKSTLTRGAIRAQLLELRFEYILGPTVRIIGNKKVGAYGVNLPKAYKAGLDIPGKINIKQFTVRVP